MDRSCTGRELVGRSCLEAPQEGRETLSLRCSMHADGRESILKDQVSEADGHLYGSALPNWVKSRAFILLKIFACIITRIIRHKEIRLVRKPKCFVNLTVFSNHP